jgi:lipase
VTPRPFVIAAHGITASGVSWDLVADKLGSDVEFVAPDLRGRGAAAAWGPPYGMAAHARDLVAVLDERGVDRAVVAGQSMGAFVAVVMADLFPDRVERLVLVDGGLPLPRPEGLSVDEILTAVIGQAMARLSMTFESRAAAHDFWRAHPALGPYWNEWIERYVDYDLTGSEPELRSKVSIDAVRGDAEDTFATTTIEDAVAALARPAVLLRAERGLMDDVPPLIPDELAARFPQVKDLGVVPGTNHYTILMGEAGASAVAAAISDA